MRALPWPEPQPERYAPDDIAITPARVAGFDARRRELIDLLVELLDGSPHPAEMIRAAPAAMRRQVETEALLREAIGEALDIQRRRYLL